ncbi:TolC family protein [Rugamonas apoptosis]|uniref:TolC family protein n=1 Tax=Rugamonas apoptosis TaxID=2758570 RepID=A0A7W2F9I3_9BURK|nr:TolC family protein [Rugamonas apoptosis]MBA5687591.1 TolC family protein [Rugamonas apoptosis]
MYRSTTLRAGACAALALALTGCAAFSPDGGLDAVQAITQAATGQALTRMGAAQDGAAAQRVAALLATPLSADNAVAIALLNNRKLQASYAELGIAEADLVQAGRLPNPTLTFSRLTDGRGLDLERKLMLPVMGMLTMPTASGIERRRFEQTQLAVAGDVLRIADQTRRAFYGAVAARQSVSYLEQVNGAAEAGAELAQRMAAAGNWSQLRQAREQLFLADAVAQLTAARQAEVAAREQLVRLLGLSGQDATFELPERLPELPAAPRELGDAEARALANRVDILMAQKELAGLAASLGLTRTTRFINVLDVGYQRNTGADGGHTRGVEIEWQLPLFDWGGARVARAEAVYTQALHRAAQGAIEARSQVRESHAAYRNAYTLARHYRDQIVPLRKRIADEQLLRYNGMLTSVFELLADAREQVLSVNAAIEAQRNFWLADAALQAAMTGAADGDSPRASR